MESININTVKDIEGAKIIDVREAYEYANGTVDGAVNVPLNELASDPTKHLNKDETYYIMCLSGGRSMMVCQALEEAEYKVVNLEGGYSGFFGNM